MAPIDITYMPEGLRDEVSAHVLKRTIDPIWKVECRLDGMWLAFSHGDRASGQSFTTRADAEAHCFAQSLEIIESHDETTRFERAA